MSSITAANLKRRGARALLCLLLSIALCASCAPAALAATTSTAEGQAFSELSKAPEAESSTQTQKTETSGTSTSSSNSKKTVIIAVAAAVALLVAIGFVIVRDARRVAPADGPVSDAASPQRLRRGAAQASRKSQGRTPSAQAKPLRIAFQCDTRTRRGERVALIRTRRGEGGGGEP